MNGSNGSNGFGDFEALRTCLIIFSIAALFGGVGGILVAIASAFWTL